MDKKKMIIGSGITALVLSGVILGAGFYGASLKPENEEIILIDEKEQFASISLEYGEEISEDKSIPVVNQEGIMKEIKALDFIPPINSLEVGITNHKAISEGEEFEVEVEVKDTKAPVLIFEEDLGDKNKMFIYGKDLSEEEIILQVKEKVKAEDEVDGELEVNVELEQVNTTLYNVIVSAEDKNSLKANEEFRLAIVNKTQEQVEKEKQAKQKKEAEKVSNEENKGEENNSLEKEDKGLIKEEKKSENIKEDPTPAQKPNLPPEPSKEEVNKKPEVKPEVKPEMKPEGKISVAQVKKSLIPWAQLKKNTGYQLTYSANKKLFKEVYVKEVIISPSMKMVSVIVHDGKESYMYDLYNDSMTVNLVRPDYSYEEEALIRAVLREVRDYHQNVY